MLPSVFTAVPITIPGGGFPGVFTGGPILWLIGGVSVTFFACEASCASSGAYLLLVLVGHCHQLVMDYFPQLAYHPA